MTNETERLNRLLENDGVKIIAPVTPEFAEILTPEALLFVAKLAKSFSQQRQLILKIRKGIQTDLDQNLSWLPEPAHNLIREENWKVNAIPKDLEKRWVEITGPASSRKMVINALNSGADIYMADAEDSESPTWNNIINGQLNLRDAAQSNIIHYTTERVYRLNDKVATLMFRPRGWHLLEKHLLVDNEPVSASLFDFGLYFFHNAKKLIAKGSGPYFYLPKLENYMEALIWNEVFLMAQNELGMPQGTIKATVLIETILAAFEMEEILYFLREHCVGLNAGRWDYLFSFIKKFHNHPQFVLPERAQLTMEKEFLTAYVNLLIQTCHKRGAHAIGGMAAQIPIKNDLIANEKALEKVRQDKLREVRAGHDGTWVAHPGLVFIAREIFEKNLENKSNQIDVKRKDLKVAAEDLLKIPAGEITEAGLRANIRVSVEYLESWLKGNGCVPINNLMEDMATAEISRSQVWQWLKHEAALNDGRKITAALVKSLLREESANRWQTAKNLFWELVTAEEFPEFLTLPAYEKLLELETPIKLS